MSELPFADRMMKALMEYLRAPTWEASRDIILARKELLNPAVGQLLEMVAKDPATAQTVYPGLEPAKAAELMSMHAAVLSQAQDLGMVRAFAFLERPTLIGVATEITVIQKLTIYRTASTAAGHAEGGPPEAPSMPPRQAPRRRRVITAAAIAVFVAAITVVVWSQIPATRGGNGIPLGDSTLPGVADAGTREVEVFSWWTGPGESEGLSALVDHFGRSNSTTHFVNASIASGSGTQARLVLQNRLQTGQPPDSYQVHAGLEAASDVKAGWLQEIGYLYDRNGWRTVFPTGLIDSMTIGGKIYAVPVNVHRSNLMWYSPQKLAQWGISAPPTSWPEFLSQADMLKARGVKAISVGATWTQMHLLENVLLGQLGASAYKGLWNSSTDWRSPQVIAALETFKNIMAVADVDTNDWQPNLDKVFAGAVAYNVMGDWAAGYLQGPKALVYKQGFDAVTSPGTAGIYNFLADSFVLPRNAPHQAAAEAWLKECASAQAQDIFNPLKGSVPARLDADKSKYTGYLSWAINEWQGGRTVVVGSLVHGAAANNAWKSEIEKAYSIFAQSKDSTRFASAVANAYTADR